MPQMTIDVTFEQATRIAEAFGKRFGFRDELGVPRPASFPEIKQVIISEIKKIVVEEEATAAKAAIVIPDVGDIT